VGDPLQAFAWSADTTVERPESAVKQKLDASRIAPYSLGMTELLEPQRAALFRDLTEQISDPVELYRKLEELGRLLDRDVKAAKAATVHKLHEGRSWNQVGELIGVSGSRAEQISRASR
jgi:hypothetical protein